MPDRAPPSTAATRPTPSPWNPRTTAATSTSAPYGNTAEASKSPAQYILVTNPNGGEKLPQKTTYSVRWRSDGFTGNVRIEYSDSGLGGPYKVLADNEPNDGSYDWSITQKLNPSDPNGYNVSDQYVIRIVSIGTPAVLDRTDSLFSVLPPITAYYVNDGSNTGDEYTAALGDDANDGLTPATPKASIRAILETYDLEYGDVIYVDTGTYGLTENIIIGHQDSGAIIRGPQGDGHEALLDRGNRSSGSYVFELDNADVVTIENLQLTGAYYGLYLDNGSSRFTLAHADVYDNNQAGLYINDAASQFATVADSRFHGDAADSNLNQDYGIYSRGLDPTILRNEAYHTNGSANYGLYLDNVGTSVTVQENRVYQNSQIGLYVRADDFRVSGNAAHDNNIGFQLRDNNATLPARAYANLAVGNSTGFQFYGYGLYSDNTAEENGTGFYLTGEVVGQNLTARHNDTGIQVDGATLLDSHAEANLGTGIYVSYYNAANVLRGNVSHSNATGIDVYGTNYGDNLLENNLVYNNSDRGILLRNLHQNSTTATTTLRNNTVYEPQSDALQVNGGSRNVILSNNILWSGASGHYALNVADDSQNGFVSDFNLLHTTGGALLGHWQADFAGLADWAYELGLDTHSQSTDPRFVDPAGADGVLGYQDGAGLLFEGFNNRDLSGPPAVTAVDRVVDVNTYDGYRGLSNDNQSFRWSGELYLPSAGTYTFQVYAYGPQRLYVGDETTPLVDDWTSPSNQEQSATYEATSAGWVSLRFEVADDGYYTQPRLSWTPPDGLRRPLRASEIVAASGGGYELRTTLRRLDMVATTGADDDFHLQSTVGSYHGGTWGADPLQSPAIDTGNPDDLVHEQSPSAGALAGQDGGRVNLGAYGNTSQASRSPSTFIQILSPNGLEKLQRNLGTTIQWRSQGTSGYVDIALSLDDGKTYTTIASGEIDDGNFSWNPTTTTLQGLIRISDTLDPTVSDVSNATFTIGQRGHVYYVNDSATTGDEYTTAPGSNANSGTTPADPMASLNAVLRAYDLEPGDIIYVDTGLYDFVANVRIGQDDQGVTFQGPVGAGHVAFLDRGNRSTGSYVFELDNADNVTIQNLQLTGAYYGLYLDNGSSRFTLAHADVYDNNQAGLYINDAASQFATVADSRFHGDAADSNLNQDYGIYSRGLDPTILRNEAYHTNGSANYGIYLDNVGTSVTVQENRVYQNSQIGLYVRADDFRVSGNAAHDNNIGFQLRDNNATLPARAYANLAVGNSTGFQFYGYGLYSDNLAEENGTGFYLTGEVVGQNLTARHNDTGIQVDGATLLDSHAEANLGTGIYVTYYNAANVLRGNVSHSNATGIDVYGTNYGDNLLENNLVYNNSDRGILLRNLHQNSTTATTTLRNNTVYEPQSDALQVNGGSRNVILSNNILWSGASGHYALNVADDSQNGFVSDFNLLHTTGGALLGHWQADFAGLADWAYELGLDTHSQSTDPRFVDPAGSDGVLGYQDGAGLLFEGFNNRDLSGPPAVTAVDRVVDVNTYDGYRGLSNDNQSFRWSGELYLPSAGTYTFQVYAYGPQRLYVGDDTTPLVDDWTSPSNQEQSATYEATSAGWVSLRFEAADDGYYTQPRLSWTPPDGLRRPLRANEIVAASGGGYELRTTLRRLDMVATTGADDDFHLQSTVGSYHGGTWGADPLQSPAIDTGDLASNYAGESAPNGGRINVGAYGNTDEASRTAPVYVQLLSFTGREKIRTGQASLIRWRSSGVPGTVDIELSTDGGATFTTISANEPNDGVFAWNPTTTTLQGLIRIHPSADATIEDVSRDVFTIGVPGKTYYVNDGSLAGDQYTTAVGDNAHSGTTPADPMASLNALLNTYDLNPGDVVYVDVGSYDLPTNVRILAEDSGVTILGPTNGGHASLDRGNYGAGRYGVEVQSAHDVTIKNLWLTGGEIGLYINNSSRVLVADSRAFENSTYGFYVETNVTDAVIRHNVAYGTTGNSNTDQNTGFYLRGDRMTVEQNTAYKVGNQLDYGIRIDNADSLIARDNLTYNNQYGLTIDTTQGEVYGNEARANNRGIYVRDSDSVNRTLVHDNSAHDNDANGMEVSDNVEFVNNLSFSNKGDGYYQNGGNSYLRDNVAYLNANGIHVLDGNVQHNRSFGNTGAGILRDGYNADVTIDGNSVYGNSVGIELSSVPYSSTSVTSNIVYDNANQGIYAHNMHQNSANSLSIVNNTVVHDVGTAIRLADNGNGVVLVNNLISVNAGLGIEISGNVSGLVSDANNVYLVFSGASFGKYLGNANSADLASWRSVSGQDAHSQSADPLFIDIDGADNLFGWEQPDPTSQFADFGSDDNFHIRGGSPMIDAGNDEYGTTRDADSRPRIDDLGTLNTGQGVYRFYDIGAYEFQGSSADATPPTIVGLAPIGMTDGVLTNARFSTLILSFSEPLDPVSAQSVPLYQIKEAGPDGMLGTLDDIPVAISSASYTFGGMTVRLNLGQTLPQGLYELRVLGESGNAVVDLAGNHLDGDADDVAGGDFVRSFRLDLTPPTVEATSPTGNLGTGPSQLTVQFNDDLGLNVGSITDPSHYSLIGSIDGIFDNADDTDESARITGVTFDAATRTATLTLSGPLPPRHYQLVIKPAIKDQAGNALNGGTAQVRRFDVGVPELAAIGDKSVGELTPLQFTATATDPDTAPANLTFSLDAGARRARRSTRARGSSRGPRRKGRGLARTRSLSGSPTTVHRR